MNTACFRLHGDLEFFLPRSDRQKAIHLEFNSGQTVKHLSESLGVPHPEIGRIEVNNQMVAFDYQPKDGDQVNIYPFEGHPDPRLAPPDEPRFLLDNHLGRLAAYLRIMGLDCLYRNDFQDETLAQLAFETNRILLTRDRQLLMRNAVRYGYCLRSLNPQDQLVEVIRRYHLKENTGHLFQRCLRCNTPLEPVSKEAVISQLEPLTRRYYRKFHRCPNCGQVYWRGSHFQRMKLLIENALKKVNGK